MVLSYWHPSMISKTRGRTASMRKLPQSVLLLFIVPVLCSGDNSTEQEAVEFDMMYRGPFMRYPAPRSFWFTQDQYSQIHRCFCGTNRYCHISLSPFLVVFGQWPTSDLTNVFNCTMTSTQIQCERLTRRDLGGKQSSDPCSVITYTSNYKCINEVVIATPPERFNITSLEDSGISIAFVENCTSMFEPFYHDNANHTSFQSGDSQDASSDNFATTTLPESLSSESNGAFSDGEEVERAKESEDMDKIVGIVSGAVAFLVLFNVVFAIFIWRRMQYKKALGKDDISRASDSSNQFVLKAGTRKTSGDPQIGYDWISDAGNSFSTKPRRKSDIGPRTLGNNQTSSMFSNVAHIPGSDPRFDAKIYPGRQRKQGMVLQPTASSNFNLGKDEWLESGRRHSLGHYNSGFRNTDIVPSVSKDVETSERRMSEILGAIAEESLTPTSSPDAEDYFNVRKERSLSTGQIPVGAFHFYNF